MKIGTLSFSETSMNFYQTTLRYNAEVNYLYIYPFGISDKV
jgi:hypothetical protein